MELKNDLPLAFLAAIQRESRIIKNIIKDNESEAAQFFAKIEGTAEVINLILDPQRKKDSDLPFTDFEEIK